MDNVVDEYVQTILMAICVVAVVGIFGNLIMSII